MKVLRQWLLTTLLFTAFTAAADLAAINREAQSLYGRAEYARALPLYRQLAEQGDSDAMRQIGFMYKEGKGVPKDFALAKSWYEKAIAAGYNRGRLNGHWLIGVLYEEGGPGLERDFIAAQRCYEKAIAVGDGDGYFYIGRLYEQGGPGIAANWATAEDWFKKAIAAGKRGYYSFIADLYRVGGPGLERDWATARDWYEQAALKEPSGLVLLRLGQLYEEGGFGLERDWVRACYYYRQAGVDHRDAAARVCR